MIDIWQEIYSTIKRNKLRTFFHRICRGMGEYLCSSSCWEPATVSFTRSNNRLQNGAIELYPHFRGGPSKPYDGLKEGKASCPFG